MSDDTCSTGFRLRPRSRQARSECAGLPDRRRRRTVRGAMVDDALVDALIGVVGLKNVLIDADVRAAYETDWTGRFHGTARCVVRPADADEVAGVMRVCSNAGAAVVPQGGNTGLVGGSVPRRGEVVVSLRRLDAIAPVDAQHGEVVVGAGAVLGA